MRKAIRWALAALIISLILPAATTQALAEDGGAPGVVGRFLLVDMNGRPVTDEDYLGKIRVVVFGYTYCPDICPTTLATLSVALDHLGADKAKIVTLFVSVDPERDSPQHLKDYLAPFPEITGLTGSPAQVAAAARNFNVRYQKQPAENGDPAAYTVDHSGSIFIMDRVGNFLARMPHESKPDRLAERVHGYLYPKKAED